MSSPGITISVILDQSWGTGYGAHFAIRNNNNFTITDWTITCNFDNSFSLTKSKILKFQTTVTSSVTSSEEVISSGWLLKRKNRRYQGFNPYVT